MRLPIASPANAASRRGQASGPAIAASLLLPLLLLAAPVGADLSFGLRAGAMDVDVAARDDPHNLALFLAYQLDNRFIDLSLGGEVNRSYSDGETARGEDLEFESEALYLEVRTTSSLFVSLRGGYLRDKIVSGSRSQRDDGFLFGGGIGFVAGRARIRLEYTDMAGDADFVSLSLQF